MPTEPLQPEGPWWPIFVENVRDYAFVLLDRDARICGWNAGAQRMLGYTSEQILGQSGDVFFTPEDRQNGEPQKELAEALLHGRAEDERWHLRRDGSRFRASGIMTAVRDSSGRVIGFGKVMRDVTERELAREATERALRERTALLREMHHRVKNNLQLVVSLIQLQADLVRDPETLSGFEQMRNRVLAIALVHERLYSTSDFATIHIGSYLESVASHLRNSYGAAERIALRFETADLAISVADAIPLALITNECLSNAFRHAFPDHRSGTLTLTLRYLNGHGGSDIPQRAELEIADDGVGLPREIELATANSMGFDLIRLLAAQLGGEASMERLQPGTALRVAFPLRNHDKPEG